MMAAPEWYWYPGPDYAQSSLAELHGELALACRNYETAEIWIWDGVENVNPSRWVLRHVLNISSRIHPIAAFDDGIVFRDRSHYLSRLTSEGSKHMVDMKTLKYRNPDTDTLVDYSSITFSTFDVIPYTPTLVPV
jgi:hypothetical protein